MEPLENAARRQFWTAFSIAFATICVALVVAYILTGFVLLWVAGFVALGVSALVLAVTRGG